MSTMTPLPESDATVVWHNVLDERYVVQVVRISRPGTIEGYAGELHVFDQQRDHALLLSEEVFLSYGAAFGPDVADVGDWQDRVMRLIKPT